MKQIFNWLSIYLNKLINVLNIFIRCHTFYGINDDCDDVSVAIYLQIYKDFYGPMMQRHVVNSMIVGSIAAQAT